MNEKDLAELQDAIGYRFEDASILERALAHASADVENNERLEFLGDSALGYAVSSALYERMPQTSVGALAERKSILVSNKRLSQIAVALGIDRCMRLGNSIANNRTVTRKIYADALEAVIGAIAKDGGFPAVQNFVDQHLYPHESKPLDIERHAKSRLQEWADRAGFETPIYKVVKHESQANGELWHVHCTIKDLDHDGEGVAHSKREAERIAAEILVSKVDEK